MKKEKHLEEEYIAGVDFYYLKIYCSISKYIENIKINIETDDIDSIEDIFLRDITFRNEHLTEMTRNIFDKIRQERGI